MNPVTYSLFLLTQAGVRSTPHIIEQITDVLSLFPDLQAVGRRMHLPEAKIAKLLKLSQHISSEQFEHNLKYSQTTAIHCLDSKYPPLLKELYDPPLVLYYRGSLKSLNTASIAMVGMRRATPYGKSALAALCKPLAGSNICIVSGLAYGIDAEAHEQALQYNIPTIAILGSAVDDRSIYPKQHVSLAHRILHNRGALISEYPPFTGARNFQFVARNRVIAGISTATIVIECAQKSGALMTADYALQLGRPVFAVPGSILSPTTTGANELIKQGAHALTKAQDLAEVLQFPLAQTEQAPSNLSEQEALVLKCMQSTPLTLDALQTKCNLPITTLISSLTTLELEKLIINCGHAGYAKL